ncbi:MAG: ACT domain-containing protein [Micropruina sp.]
MAKHVLTAIGDDRTGLVAALAGIVTDHDGNWLESQMARLAGKFTGVVLVDIPDERLPAFLSALADLDRQGILTVTATKIDDAATAEPGATLALYLVGHDRPGIVHQVTRVLAGHGVMIEELSSSVSEAPMAGGLLFQATASLRAPKGVSADELRTALEGLANELMVDIEISHQHD